MKPDVVPKVPAGTGTTRNVVVPGGGNHLITPKGAGGSHDKRIVNRYDVVVPDMFFVLMGTSQVCESLVVPVPLYLKIYKGGREPLISRSALADHPGVEREPLGGDRIMERYTKHRCFSKVTEDSEHYVPEFDAWDAKKPEQFKPGPCHGEVDPLDPTGAIASIDAAMGYMGVLCPWQRALYTQKRHESCVQTDVAT